MTADELTALRTKAQETVAFYTRRGLPSDHGAEIAARTILALLDEIARLHALIGDDAEAVLATDEKEPR